MAATRKPLLLLFVLLLSTSAVTVSWLGWRAPINASAAETSATDIDQAIDQNAASTITRGRQIFRYDTFGDEAFWTDALGMQRAIEGSELGGVGAGVSPKLALSVGLKVDMDKLPPDLAKIPAVKPGSK